MSALNLDLQGTKITGRAPRAARQGPRKPNAKILQALGGFHCGRQALRFPLPLGRKVALRLSKGATPILPLFPPKSLSSSP
jgi:hypothetical protein